MQKKIGIFTDKVSLVLNWFFRVLTIHTNVYRMLGVTLNHHLE